MPYLNNSSKGIGMNNFKKLGKKRDCYNYKKHSFFLGGGSFPKYKHQPFWGMCTCYVDVCIRNSFSDLLFCVIKL